MTRGTNLAAFVQRITGEGLLYVVRDGQVEAITVAEYIERKPWEQEGTLIAYLKGTATAMAAAQRGRS